MIRHEAIKDLVPASNFFKHLDPPLNRRIKAKEEAVGQLPVGVIFGQNKNVWLMPVNQSWLHVTADEGADEISADFDLVERPNISGLKVAPPVKD